MSQSSDARRIMDAARAAGERIAPTWPLDRLIAVNPWWGLRHRSFGEVSAVIDLLGHAHCLMPRDWFRTRWEDGAIGREHLLAAADEHGGDLDEPALIAWLTGTSAALHHWRNISDQLDARRDLARQVSWHEEIVHQISQFCASFYTTGNPLPSEPDRCLYEAWLDAIRHDRGIEITMGEAGLHRQFQILPRHHQALLREAVAEIGVPAEGLEDYFHALMLDINGWASWVAYVRWQARLEGGRAGDVLPQLLAVRLAWDLALWRQVDDDPARRQAWRQQFADLSGLMAQHRESQRPALVWQRAAEIAYQDDLGRRLLEPVPSTPASRPSLQAAFCIDVRSEVYRRALEAQDAGIQTIGFAGFFGLPISYQPAGATYQRPQLPGLLAPTITVSEDSRHPAVASRPGRFNLRARWEALAKAAPAAFGYVEAVGAGYAVKMLQETLVGDHPAHPVNRACRTDARYVLRRGGEILDAAAQADLAAPILRAMTLTEALAPVILLVGHGSSTRNNPHAAGLDCGACCGQTGEVNARVLAQILQDPDVRQALQARHGLAIPADTRFVAALHDTTTDDVHLLDSRPEELADVVPWLAAASASARRERASRLGVDPSRSDVAIRGRSRDWSQIRPEWGLAGNACFIVAPRSRVQHLDLAGRGFLHDYDWRADAAAGYPVLELIMTAPMVVTHWINMQYNASVADNGRYGAGNKVLHNVVGGNIGVFEGNGGDLRIGLPLQSVHDGERWMHEPLRLSVYLAAPPAAIADIATRHEVVRELVDNDWLYLFCLDDEAGTIRRLYRGAWSTVAPS